ncbi:hypothetical protein EV189_3737 [Motilibacter rhizosphaerae]|uniref:Uncharacterized protein n=1 Tax=Motilibacter rhizosphaerae TaxID=598652 RepID=A0A4Q7NAH2_9ACTN|nr:hypothetical protein [Motilibacter rhizosphaerae]RZS79385.1 hypothetical protein EV189_3737 [Motilibacter rhizosphaerae]
MKAPRVAGTVLLAVLLVLGAVRLVTLGTGTTAGAAATAPSFAAAVPEATDPPGLTAEDPTVDSAGGDLLVRLRLHDGDDTPVVLTALIADPPFTGELPAGGFAVGAHQDAAVVVRWPGGPDCTRDVPDEIVGDLHWTGTRGGQPASGAVPGGDLEALARQVWLDTCAGRPTEGGVPRTS